MNSSNEIDPFSSVSKQENNLVNSFSSKVMSGAKVVRMCLTVSTVITSSLPLDEFVER